MKRCPGLAGARVYTEASVHSVALSFRWGKRKAPDVVKNDSIGTKLEWRGTGNRERFKPHAVIVSTTRLPADRLREVQRICYLSGTLLLQLRFSLEELPTVRSMDVVD